tara:strand:- start:15 stop:278 length:264 start_codon:yes stop_codon:yes gene_type:complete
MFSTLYTSSTTNSVEDAERLRGLSDPTGKLCSMVIATNAGMLDGIRPFSVFDIADIVKLLCCDADIVSQELLNYNKKVNKTVSHGFL